MFKKAPTVAFKGEQKLRGKEAKKLRETIINRFADGEAAAAALLPGKADVVLKKAQGSSSSSVAFVFVDGDPMLVQPDGRGDIGDAAIFPTLQALWRAGSEACLPCVLIQRPVAKFVFGGANVMAPGIHSVLMPEGSTVMEGAFVAVRCVGNPSACAVGVLKMPISSLGRGAKGEAVEVLHYFGDMLWEAGGRPRPAGFVGTTVEATDAEEEARLLGLAGKSTDEGAAAGADPDSDDEAASSDEDDSDSEKKPSFNPPERTAQSESADKASEDGGSDGGEADEAVTEESMTPEMMTKALEECFLQAVKTRIKDKDLPLTGNVLYAQHMRPCRRAGSNVDVKSSSCKKLVTFLQRLEELGWLALKAHSADPVVTKVCRDHPDVREWKPWPKSATAEAEAEASGTAGGKGSAPSATIAVEMVWLVAKKLAPFIEALGTEYATEDGCWTQADCVAALKHYGDSKNLWLPNNRKRMGPDPLLEGILGEGATASANSSGGAGNSLEGLAEKLLKISPIFHRVSAPQGGAGGGVKKSVRPGKPPVVQVRTDQRKGKNVTVVHGLENYGVDTDALATCLQKALATAASVEEANGSTQAGVMVSGFWDISLVEWLSKIGIPPDSIQHLPKKGQGQKKVKQATNVRKS